MPVEAKQVQPGFYDVQLSDELIRSGVKLLQSRILLAPETTRSEKLKTNLQIHFDKPKPSMISISSQTVMGELVHEDNSLTMIYCNHISLSIVMYI